MGWIAFCLAWLPLAAAAQAPDFTALVRDQGAAVVNISAGYATPPVLPDLPHDESLAEFLERLADDLEARLAPQALGSGFIVSADGDVVTNFHVVEGAFDEGLIVRLADGRELLASVVGVDRATDIALLKVPAAGLPRVRIGDPRRLQVGEWVASIGSPFGLERSLAAGIVSALGRNIPGEMPLHLIQTDAAMNPGTSGAPLFNLRGEVVGVSSFIFSNTGTSIGLSFAVPIDTAMRVVEELRRHGSVTRGRLGLRLQALTPELAGAFRVPHGALVSDVERGAPAHRAGIRSGDIIVAFGGEAITSHEQLLELVARSPPRTSVAVQLARDGVLTQVAVQVAPAAASRIPASRAEGTDRLGLRLAPRAEGVLVQRAAGAARRAGLLAGDVILRVNGRGTRSVESFNRAVASAPRGEAVALLVQRGGTRTFLALRIP